VGLKRSKENMPCVSIARITSYSTSNGYNKLECYGKLPCLS